MYLTGSFFPQRQNQSGPGLMALDGTAHKTAMMTIANIVKRNFPPIGITQLRLTTRSR